MASLKFAIDETNAHTSNQSKNSFTLKIANASQHQSLHQHGKLRRKLITSRVTDQLFGLQPKKRQPKDCIFGNPVPDQKQKEAFFCLFLVWDSIKNPISQIYNPCFMLPRGPSWSLPQTMFVGNILSLVHNFSFPWFLHDLVLGKEMLPYLRHRKKSQKHKLYPKSLAHSYIMAIHGNHMLFSSTSSMVFRIWCDCFF